MTNASQKLKNFIKEAMINKGKARKLLLKQAIKLAEFNIGATHSQRGSEKTNKRTSKKNHREYPSKIRFNWTRDEEHSNKLFFKATKQRIALETL